MLILFKTPDGVRLPKEAWKADYSAALRFGQAALGEQALYISGEGSLRLCCIPLAQIECVFKRLAVTKGYFSGGVFGALPYLVVRYSGGERVFRFRREEELDLLLQEIRSRAAIAVGKP